MRFKAKATYTATVYRGGDPIGVLEANGTRGAKGKGARTISFTLKFMSASDTRITSVTLAEHFSTLRMQDEFRVQLASLLDHPSSDISFRDGIWG